MPSQRRVQWAEVRIASVAVAALAILIVLVYLLSGGTWLQPKAHLTTHVPDPVGLDVGGDVELNGVPIGKVESLRLTNAKDPNREVEVGLKIEEKYRPYIPDDSLADIDSESLLGDKYIAISIGHSSHPVPRGGDLPFRPPSQLVTNMDLQQFGAQLRQIDNIIRDVQEGKNSLGQFIHNEDIYNSTLAGISKIEAKMRAATSTPAALGELLHGTAMHRDIDAPLKELDASLAKFQASPYLRDPKLYNDVRDQAAKLRQSLADFNAGKGAGQWVASDAAYLDWNRRVAALMASIDALYAGDGAMWLANGQVYESITGSLQEMEKTVKEFREDPQKFLRIKIF